MPILGITASSILKVTSSYESIATVTAAGTETSLNFTSIPGTYSHLQIRGIARTLEVAANSRRGTIRFNSDSAANYTQHNLQGNGSTASALGYSGLTYIYIQQMALTDGSTANAFGVSIMDVIDYASTSKFKTLRVIDGGDNNTASTSFQIGLGSGLWRSTSAITAIEIGLDGATFKAGSTFALYGIRG
jgi:hypothetical protein